MADSGSAAASTTQPKGSSRASKLSERFKKLSLHVKSKDREASASQSKCQNGARIDHEHQAPAQNKESVTGVSASVLSTAVKQIPPSSQNDPFPAAIDTHRSYKDVPTAIEALCPMRELWNQAYDELKEQEGELIKDYEDILRGDLAAMIGSTVVFSGSKVERKEQMATLLNRKVKEVKRNAWKLKFGGKDIPLKDLVQPVVGIIQWADDYISSALSTNPYASLAWGGVSLLLPLTLNPSKQAASLATGLDYISDLIVRSTMREKLYERRYGSTNSGEDQETLMPSHMMYQDTLKSLYIQILKFQASSICYLSKNGAIQVSLDMIKWDDWESSLSDIQKREDAFRQVYDIWKDTTEQEDSEALFAQHQEKMNVMMSISEDVSGLRNAIEKAQRDAQRTNLLDWLSTIDSSKFYNSGLDKLRADTGDWLLNGDLDFERWQTSPNSFAWLNGKAGSGKSVLSSSIIRYLKERYDSSPETALAFFYFSFTDAKTQNVVEMLCSLIKQICCRRPNTPPSVKSLTEYKEKGHRPDRKTLEDILIDTIHGFSKVYIVLDALDECPSENSEREKLLESLSRIHNKGSQNLHLLCTSRRIAEIDAILEPITCSYSNINIDLSAHKKAVDRDISLHIDSTFMTEPFKSWPDIIQAEAKAALIEKADGMFQYVACQFDALRRHRAPGKIRDALRDLPEGLDATYDRMLQDVDPKYRKQVSSFLKWLAFSFRPLTNDEIAEIFILDHEKALPFNQSDRLFSAKDVLTYLPGLVTELPVVTNMRRNARNGEKATEIRFAHFSIQEYLCSKRVVQEDFSTREQTSHLHIAESCLAYHLQLSESILATEDSLRQYALWKYVVHCGVRHLDRVALESWSKSLTSRATSAFSARSKSLLNMVRIRDPDRGWLANWQKGSDELATPLYYSTSVGAFQMASLLIRSGVEVNKLSLSGLCGTALQAAAYKGDQEIIQLLLDNGANVNTQGGIYGTALQAAAVGRNQEIVQLLLDNGADINAQGGVHGTALKVAAARDNQEIVKLLLDNGADINAEGGKYGTALQAAAAAINDNQDIVRLLLKKGADINAQGGRYGTALQAAAATDNQDIVRLLLKKGANINAQGGRYGTALQAAIARNGWEVIELLVTRGAKVDPHGAEFEELLGRIGNLYSGGEEADRLRKFQENPSGYIELRRREIEELKRRELGYAEDVSSWGESSEDLEDSGSLEDDSQEDTAED